jgi:ABC-type nickel/cobalt efflux system permease component RcnA
MLSFLALGFLIGLRHALEPDHVAAVLTMRTRGGSVGDHARSGMLWGIGHALTLLLLAGGCVLFGVLVPERLGHLLEGAVGVMLIGLGVSVFVRLRREGIRFDAHAHADGTTHIHAHVHPSGPAPAAHRHDHPHRRPALGTLLVGALHGLAGSAALVLLVGSAAAQSPAGGSPLLGLAYVALFGVGAIVGMMGLAVTVSLPVRFTARYRRGVYGVFSSLVALASIAIGGQILWSIVDAARS